MKRKNSSLVYPRGKRQKIELSPCIDKTWVSATQTRNYMLKDPLLDWLNLYGESKNFEKDYKNNDLNFTAYVMQKGNEFEDYVISQIKDKHRDYFTTISNPVTLSIQETYQKQIQDTFEAMIRGDCIIYQGLVFDPVSRSFGYPDLIVRSDYLNNLVQKPVITAKKARKGCAFSSSWHYRVVDVKFTILKMRSDNNSLLDVGSMPAYKSQTYIYNRCLGYMQFLIPRKAYIMGRGWSSCKDSADSPFDRLAQIDFLREDAYVSEHSRLALEWIIDLRLNGGDWSIFPVPSRKELYPNMCNEMDHGWHNSKLAIAKRLKDITLLWQCGVTHRERAHDQDIFQWDDTRLNSTLLQVKSTHTSLLDKMLKINIDHHETVSVNKKILSDVLPEDDIPVYFVDFETVTNISSVTTLDIECNIFMMGVGYIDEKGTWNFKVLTVDKLKAGYERTIIQEFLNYLPQKCRLYHYSNCEPVQFKKALTRHGIVHDKELVWTDLLDIVKKSQFVVKHALNFSLKTITSALASHGLISVSYDNAEIHSGSEAMIAAFRSNEIAQQENSSMKTCKIMKCVQEYNELDCKTLSALLTTLRNLVN